MLAIADEYCQRGDGHERDHEARGVHVRANRVHEHRGKHELPQVHRVCAPHAEEHLAAVPRAAEPALWGLLYM